MVILFMVEYKETIHLSLRKGLQVRNIGSICISIKTKIGIGVQIYVLGT